MDNRCVFYCKPLLESGTLGTKGNTQVVVPHLTESYGSSRDPPEKSIPICTLKNFPNLIEHTLQWARDLFEGIFTQVPESINQYISTPNFVEQLLAQPGSHTETLTAIRDNLGSKPQTFEDCIVWARLRFQELFHNTVAQLLFNFPPDQVTSSGQPFWSGPKRCPHVLNFDANDEGHLSFIVAAANLRANVFNLKGDSSPEFIKAVLARVQVPPFVPQSGIKIETDEKKAAEARAAPISDEAALKQLLAELPPKLPGFQVRPQEFEKVCVWMWPSALIGCRTTTPTSTWTLLWPPRICARRTTRSPPPTATRSALLLHPLLVTRRSRS